MHKLFKKFGSLALVVCTVVALAALPVSAWGDVHASIGYDPSIEDAYDNKFTPGFVVDGDGLILNYAETHGTVQTFTHTLSLQKVYGLSVCTANYNDAAHSSERVAVLNELGLMTYPKTIILNHLNYTPKIYNRATREYEPANEVVQVENIDNNEWFSVNARIMLSNSKFVQPDTYVGRFPTALAPFDWTESITLAELTAS